MSEIKTETKINPEDVRFGDQIAYWMYDQNWNQRPYFGTVLEVGETTIGGEPRQYLTVCEMPTKRILAHQITRIIKKRHSVPAVA